MKQGKIISVPVTEVSNGVKVVFEGNIYKVKKVDRHVYPVVLEGIVGSRFLMEDLKTLAVEYPVFKNIQLSGYGEYPVSKVNIPSTEQIPLSPKQWQQAIDDELVNSDKEVWFGGSEIEAKIITTITGELSTLEQKESSIEKFTSTWRETLEANKDSVKHLLVAPEKLLREDRTLYCLHTRLIEKRTRWNPNVECNKFSIGVQPDYGGGITDQEAVELAKEIEIRYNSFTELKDRCNRLEMALRGIIEIGKRDMSNPKYDGYFEEAKEVLKIN